MSTFLGFGYTEDNYLVRGIREITDLLLAVNSSVNFILYCTFNKMFRKHFMLVFCARSQCANRQVQSNFEQEETCARRTSATAPAMTHARQTMNGGALHYEPTLCDPDNDLENCSTAVWSSDNGEKTYTPLTLWRRNLLGALHVGRSDFVPRTCEGERLLKAKTWICCTWLVCVDIVFGRFLFASDEGKNRLKFIVPLQVLLSSACCLTLTLRNVFCLFCLRLDDTFQHFVLLSPFVSQSKWFQNFLKRGGLQLKLCQVKGNFPSFRFTEATAMGFLSVGW